MLLYCWRKSGVSTCARMSLRIAAEKFSVSLARRIYGGIGAIFCLHRIVPEAERSALPDNRALEIRPEDLREMLAWVAGRGLDVIPLDQVPVRLARPRGEVRLLHL